nr:MAG TPA: hypothetical protein [Caudoviricetes sp.]
MAILYKHNCDNSIQKSILNTLFGAYYPPCDINFNNSSINITILKDNEGCLYHTNWKENIPYNNIYISGMNEVGMIFQVKYIPENFKIHNHTGNQIFIKEIITTDLKGDLIFENMYLDLLENMNLDRIKDIPSILSKRLEKVTSMDFGETGGFFIRCFEDFVEKNYKFKIFDKIIKIYYSSFKQYLNYLPHIQLVINVAAVGRVVIYLDLKDRSKSYFV